MLSSIKIDAHENGVPFIKVTRKWSEDLRDKFVWRFGDKLQGSSITCCVIFDGDDLIITPLSVNEIGEHFEIQNQIIAESTKPMS